MSLQQAESGPPVPSWAARTFGPSTPAIHARTFRSTPWPSRTHHGIVPARTMPGTCTSAPHSRAAEPATPERTAPAAHAAEEDPSQQLDSCHQKKDEDNHEKNHGSRLLGHCISRTICSGMSVHQQDSSVRLGCCIGYPCLMQPDRSVPAIIQPLQSSRKAESCAKQPSAGHICQSISLRDASIKKASDARRQHLQLAAPSHAFSWHSRCQFAFVSHVRSHASRYQAHKRMEPFPLHVCETHSIRTFTYAERQDNNNVTAYAGIAPSGPILSLQLSGLLPKAPLCKDSIDGASEPLNGEPQNRAVEVLGLQHSLPPPSSLPFCRANMAFSCSISARSCSSVGR